VNVSDYGNAYLISFETDEDMDNAFYELIHDSRSGFTSGASKRQIILSGEQIELLKTKNIRYKIVA
jgi:hypothetical protein